MITGKILVPLIIAGVSFFIGGYYPADEVAKKLVNQGVLQEQKKDFTKTCIDRLRGKVRIDSENEWSSNPSLGFQDATFSMPETDQMYGAGEFFSENYRKLLRILLD